MGINQACTNTNMDEVLVNHAPELQGSGWRHIGEWVVNISIDT